MSSYDLDILLTPEYLTGYAREAYQQLQLSLIHI